MKLIITPEEREGLKETFKNFNRRKTKEEVFYDLCFCINAPQTTFENNRKVIRKLLALNFYWIKEPTPSFLYDVLKPVRFYRNKTKYLLEMKKIFNYLYTMIVFNKSIWRDDLEIREWLVRNVKGLGYKTASHFLRNLGNKNLAIIDTHIMKFLARYVGNWNPNTKKGYLCIEGILEDIAQENNLSIAELDALIWQRYSGTKWKDFKY